MCFGVALAEVCFGTFLFVAASGRKYVLVPIFPVSIVAASGRNLFWFLLFQQLRHCIWWVFCFGSYFSSLYVAASGGKFVLVPIFQRLLWYYLAGILFLVPIFPAPISYVSQFTCFDCIYIYVRYFSLGPCDINGPRFSDGNTSGIQPQSIQERLGMSAFRLFTAHQLMIYRDHNAQSRSYDSVSMFGMCPPELVGVFQQTKFYI